MFHVSTLLPTDPDDKQQVTIQFNIPKTNQANYLLTNFQQKMKLKLFAKGLN